MKRAARGFSGLENFVYARSMQPFSDDEISASRDLLQSSHRLMEALQRRLCPDFTNGAQQESSQGPSFVSADQELSSFSSMTDYLASTSNKRSRTDFESGTQLAGGSNSHELSSAALSSETRFVVLEGVAERPAQPGACLEINPSRHARTACFVCSCDTVHIAFM